MTDALPAPLVLRCVRGHGPGGRRALVAEHGSMAAALAAVPPELRVAAERQAREVHARCRAAGLAIVAHGEAAWPAHLDALEDAPPVLFVAGRVELLDAPSVAVVGTRAPSSYGERVTRRLVGALAAAGVTIVSGLARGIDAIAHEGALGGSGSTIAVLGTGADRCYPLQNQRLYERICEAGAVCSEALPGAAAHAGAFPRRNRIIAALADVTVVVEAGLRSGALITARHADALNRRVAAIPGPVDAPGSEGTNALLRDGAHCATGADDILALLDLTVRGRRRARPAVATTPVSPMLDGDEAAVWALVCAGDRHPDELMHAAGLSASRAAVAVAALEARGLVRLDTAGLIGRAS